VAFALGSSAAPTLQTALPRADAKEMPAKTAGPVVLPEGTGKAIVQRTCSGTCHGLDAVTGVRRNRAAWTAMVDNMVARGANAKDNETKVIVDYLVKYFGK
jgi:cytochrome c5